ncbi:hypothetical protein FGE12_12795 [Aggregicoccus sp. 17bor-14]|uniref:hypothetical protein n=1 Tax=Myxococcaceae TaxID=31 RepID=UPI00129C8475|nr:MULTISPECIES: hypothetical protein [Myxococcaceae]MBF5043270.1 hypothetical protein [Simulacricoccus sp. 17bor-14]MRI89027.1 hypothetical protein [Aggregicoccus sp. 17bor-14]
MSSLALVSLLSLLAQTPTSSASEPEPEREVHFEALVSLLAAGGAVEFPLGLKDGVVLETGVGPELGFSLLPSHTGSSYSSGGYTGIGASMVHVSLGWRHRAGERSSVDLGVRAMQLLTLPGGEAVMLFPLTFAFF